MKQNKILLLCFLICTVACTRNHQKEFEGYVDNWNTKTRKLMAQNCSTLYEQKKMYMQNGHNWIEKNKIRTKLLQYIRENNQDLFSTTNIYFFESFTPDEYKYHCYVWYNKESIYDFYLLGSGNSGKIQLNIIKKGTDSYELLKSLVFFDFLSTECICYYTDVLYIDWQCYTKMDIKNNKISDINCDWFQLVLPESLNPNYKSPAPH